MTDKGNLRRTIVNLPSGPGVYFFKDKNKKIIYVGKAANIKNRVRQYFQNSRASDFKTDLLIKEAADLDWTNTESEIDALFLESEMIKRYMPKYNIELRDDKHYQYVRIDIKSKHPTVHIVRRPLDDGAKYFGPYISGVRQALRYLRKIFPFDAKQIKGNRPTLHYHLGLSPGLEDGRTTLEQYRSDLRKLMMYLKGERSKLEKQLEKEMKLAAKAREFEKAAHLRNQIIALGNLKKQVIFSKEENFDVSKDQALNQLSKLLNDYNVWGAQQSTKNADGVSGYESKQAAATGKLRRIEGYDISHMSGRHNVASMVVFTNGVSDKKEYRKFKMRTPGNDDFAHMYEVISRRFSSKNIENWPKPDLILIDGGKGQLKAALSALDSKGVAIPTIGLAKRYERIYIPKTPLINRQESKMKIEYEEIELAKDSHVLRLLQRIRDESHRFAVSYHSSLKTKGQTASLLEEIPGIGPATRKKLVKKFGSFKGVKSASEEELAEVVGRTKAKLIRQCI